LTLTSDYYKMVANSLSLSRVTAPLLEPDKHAKALNCMRAMVKRVIFAQFCRPYAKYIALRQLLIGV